MIGYQSLIHQGWSDRKLKGKYCQNPYPQGSSACRDYEMGVFRFELGKPWKEEKQ